LGSLMEFQCVVGLAFGDDLAAAAPQDDVAVADVEDRAYDRAAAVVLVADTCFAVGSAAAVVSDAYGDRLELSGAKDDRRPSRVRPGRWAEVELPCVKCPRLACVAESGCVRSPWMRSAAYTAVRPPSVAMMAPLV
jgi:hypothetical protein